MLRGDCEGILLIKHTQLTKKDTQEGLTDAIKMQFEQREKEVRKIRTICTYNYIYIIIYHYYYCYYIIITIM